MELRASSSTVAPPDGEAIASALGLTINEALDPAACAVTSIPMALTGSVIDCKALVSTR